MMSSSHQVDSEADPETTANLKDLAQACSKSLKRALAEEEAQEAIVAAKEGFWASRQFAEFNLWCTKIGIHAQGLRSIDARLKDVPDICNIIRRLLQSLEGDLNDLLYPAGAIHQVTNTDDFEHEDSSDDSSLSFDSLPSFEGLESESVSAAKKRNDALRQHIEDTIDRLHGHALQIDKAGAKHRRERIEIYQQKEGSKIAYDGFKKIAIAKAKGQFPNASENFRERMAESFARRRIRFEYLEKHRKKRDINVVIHEGNLPSGPEPKPSTEGVSGSQDLLPQTEGLKQAVELKSQHQQYQNTVYSATEITKLDIGPQSRAERPERPESVASVALRHCEFPKPPQVTGSSFRCPYCRIDFRDSEAQKARWVEHVMHDFEPYFCTVENCTAPFDVPNTFNGLLEHLQIHLTQRYHVDLPNGEHWEVDEEGFEKHLLTHNDMSVETCSAMKEASRRKGVFMFQSCPFCGGFPDDIQKRFPEPVAPEAQIELRHHIKRHMQDIALFLPPYREDEEDTPQSSASSQINSQDRSSLGPPEDFRNACDLAVCDCKHEGEYPEESASTSRVIPDLYIYELTMSNELLSDEKDADIWAKLFPESPRYDKSRVGDEYYLQDKHLSLFAAARGSIEWADPHAYTVGWICAIRAGYVAARAFLDEEHERPLQVAPHDNNCYVLGRIGNHNVIIATLPDGEYSTPAAIVARDMLHTFPNVRIGLIVGIGGGVPSGKHDIRLGDVVVGSRSNGNYGVFQYDFGKTIQNGEFHDTGFLNLPPESLRVALASIRADYELEGHQLVDKVKKNLENINKRERYMFRQPDPGSDRLYKRKIVHPSNSPHGCDVECGDDAAYLVSRHRRDEGDDDPAIHYGLIASGNQLIKDAFIRDLFAVQRDVLCFETEADGFIEDFPCLVIRGICDYSDTHQNKEWQGFAAMMAAAYAKDLLRHIAPDSIDAEKPILKVLNSSQKDLHSLKQTADEPKMEIETIHSDQVILSVDLPRNFPDLKLDKSEDLSVARNPHFLVPFPFDPDFINRSNILTWMEKQYDGPESWFALVGLGGLGKSHMAIQFAYKVHATLPETSVFWVRGSTKATFEESYRSIADVLALPRRHDPEISVLALVHDWLQREDVSPWLMIVDDLDSSEILFSKNRIENIAGISTGNFLPKTDKGKILFTSRSLDAAERLTGNRKAVLQVPTMEEVQAVLLLQERLHQDINRPVALRLVKALEFIPLAVTQAAAYINKRTPRMTIHSYLDELQKGEKRKGTLLRNDQGDTHRYEGVSNSVLVTWQATFEQIKREHPGAANLLSLLSEFHAQNIPKYMLHDYNSEGNDDDDDETSENGDFEDDLDVLRGYSLITMTAVSGFCEMHSLVQFAAKVWISEFGRPDRWKKLFLRSASRHFPSGVFETWEQCQTLMPHVQPLLNEEPSAEGDRLEWSELLTNVSRYLRMLGDYSRAEGYIREAVRVRTETLGEEHPTTLTSMANLASTYCSQCRWEKAQELERRVTDISLGVLGKGHPDTLTSMANLALIYGYQGRWKEAEEVGVWVADTTTRVFGEEHPNTLLSMANLAYILTIRGRWNESEKLGIQVLETRKRLLGEEHPETLQSVSNLALMYRHQERWREAEELNIQVMETRKMMLGKGHPETLTSMHNLAFIWKGMERWKGAIEMMQDCVHLRESLLGADHTDTVSSASALLNWRAEFRRNEHERSRHLQS